MREPHPLAGKTVRLIASAYSLTPFRVEDWWQNIAGRSWMDAEGNPAALQYAIRMASARLPLDNEVVYGKIGILGFIVHVSELGEEIQQA